MHILGVDIGGTGIKGAIVNTLTGELISERHRIPTPSPATPQAVAEVLTQLVTHFQWKGPIGCGLPATIHNGVAKTAANIDPSWIDTNAAELFSQATGQPCYLINDADAAGMAEMQFGAGFGHQGVVIIMTIGTGIGSAVFTQGKLLPNTEFGHLLLKGIVAENYISARVREKEDLSWKQWGRRFNRYLQRIEFLLSPDLIIVGGGASKKFDKYQDKLEIDAEIIPAEGLNLAGIIGAALFAQKHCTK